MVFKHCWSNILVTSFFKLLCMCIIKTVVTFLKLEWDTLAPLIHSTQKLFLISNNFPFIPFLRKKQHHANFQIFFAEKCFSYIALNYYKYPHCRLQENFPCPFSCIIKKIICSHDLIHHYAIWLIFFMKKDIAISFLPGLLKQQQSSSSW